MKRNIKRSLLSSVVAALSIAGVAAQASIVPSSIALAGQAQTASRWQAERFGPIVSSDTLWTIAMYYSDKRDLNVYEMMDLIIEANPRVFPNGLADHMLDGFYLTIPTDGMVATTEVTVAKPKPTAGDNSAQPAASQTSQAAAAGGLAPSELAGLRNQLAQSIELIEQLQRQNLELHERLLAVTEELGELRLKVNAEQQAEAELQQQISAEVTAQRQESVTTETPADATAAALQAAASVAAEQSEQANQAASIRQQPPAPAKPSLLAWLMQPLHLLLVVGVPLLLVLLFGYRFYRQRQQQQSSQYKGALDAAAREQQSAVAADSAAAASAVAGGTVADAASSQVAPTLETVPSAFEEAEQAALAAGVTALAADAAQADDAAESAAEPAAESEAESAADDAAELAKEQVETDAAETSLEQSLQDLDAELEFTPQATAAQDSSTAAEPDAELETELDAELETELDAELETELDAELETELDAEPETELDAELDTELDAEPDDLDAELEALFAEQDAVFTAAAETRGDAEPTDTAESAAENLIEFELEDSDLSAANAAEQEPDDGSYVDQEFGDSAYAGKAYGDEAYNENQYQQEYQPASLVESDDEDLAALLEQAEDSSEASWQDEPAGQTEYDLSQQDSDDDYLAIEQLLEEAEAEGANDFSHTLYESEAGSLPTGEDTALNHLDLAQTYLDMGDFAAARAELLAIDASNDEDLQREIAMLQQQIDEQDGA
ncbi:MULTISPECIES: hypothetical protein [Idiomarina]|uniref:hypothetical protein n=1 Tax=Idiomarina TaxID=135575 RepID=UPI00129BB17C|nr:MULTISPECIES: hypothetical protein [Idiomarina]MRJ41109.1 hypothetical protein [Idiomarina sp. FeN1]NCU56274.1 hypothetical protein [Idiomarina sp. FenA--70]NCU59293.1 hypothetical protein [Idiomarina sp. FenBw--71]UUN12472.1 hypothetical protein KGF88_07305 [Idiomarina loihiensis]